MIIQEHSQVSFAEAGFSFSEELVWNIFSAHVVAGAGMILTDYLRIKIYLNNTIVKIYCQ